MKNHPFVVEICVYIKNKYVGDVLEVLNDGKFKCGFWEYRLITKSIGIFGKSQLQHLDLRSFLIENKNIKEYLEIPYTLKNKGD